MPLDRYRLILAASLCIGLGMPAIAQDAAPAADTPTAPDTESAPAEPAGTPTDAAGAPSAGGTAQEDAGSAQDGSAAPDAAAGEPAQPEIREIVRDTFGDWQVRCAPEGEDCFMYQLARDSQKNPVVEVSLLKLPESAGAAAGVTMVTPLGTLLTSGIVMQIDTGEARQYPFNWCSQVGCFSRFGLTQQSINGMKRGKAGKLLLASVGAPDKPVDLTLSLTGFTAAYDSLQPPKAPEAPPPAQ